MRAEKRARLHVTCMYKCGQTAVKLHNKNFVRICPPFLIWHMRTERHFRNQQDNFLEYFITKPPKYVENQF